MTHDRDIRPAPAARPYEACARFARDRRGVVAVVFGLMAMPMVVLAGGAVDYARAARTQTALQGVADAAALAGALEGEKGGDEAAQRAVIARIIASHCGGSGTADTEGGEADSAAARDGRCGRGVSHVPLIEEDGTVKVTLTSEAPTAFLGLVRMEAFDVGVDAVVRASSPAVDVHFVIDMSGSMNIAYGPAEMDRLHRAWKAYWDPGGDTPEYGCSFACHQILPGQWADHTGISAARDAGVVLREDHVHDETVDVIASLRNAPFSDRVRVSVSGFGHLTGAGHFETFYETGDDLNAASAALSAVELLSGDTALPKVFPEVVDVLDEAAESGPEDPLKLVVLMTDGLDTDDADRESDGGWRLKPIDPALCDPVKATGAKIFVMNVVYPRPETILGNAEGDPAIGRIQAVYDDIAPALKACASDDLYVEATHGSTFKSAFRTLEKELKGISRLYLAQ